MALRSRFAFDRAIRIARREPEEPRPGSAGGVRPPEASAEETEPVLRSADGTRELVFEPQEFLERLAAMTPRLESNLLICHGVLAPRARWRERVVAPPTGGARAVALAPPLAPGPEATGVKSSPRAWTWAALMHRALAIDVLACPHCGGRLRLIATLHNPAIIRKILAHVGIAPSGQSPGPAPPEPRAATS